MKKTEKTPKPVSRHAIWVYASHVGGTLSPVTLELLGKGQLLAERAGVPLEAVLMGHGTDAMVEALLESGAEVIRMVDDPQLATFASARYAHVLSVLVKRHDPQVLLLGADPGSATLAARVAARLGTGLSAHCVDLKFEGETLVQTVPGFGGQLLANIVCPQKRPQMATVTAGIFKPVRRVGRNPEIVLEPVTVPGDVRTTQQVEVRRRSVHEDAPLAQAEVVVAGGYGVGSAEGWRLVERLADVLDGVVGATRPPVDEGWTTKDRMIGASGKVISPRLYVALGISGMMHHTVGVHGARTIVAINSDPKAPIFSMADYGLVGNVREVVPALVSRLASGMALAPSIQPPDFTRTGEEYRASLQAMRPNMYKNGRLIQDPTTDPYTRRTIEGHAQCYDAARDPRYQDMLTAISHLSGKRVSRYLTVIRSFEDQLANSRLKRLMFQMTGTCTGGRCVGWAAMNAMWSTTYDIDQEFGTSYHQRLTEWLRSAQERDITVCGALTDPKGHRRRAPSKQQDPDMFLRIVQRRDDGIVVRGAKIMICGTAAANEVFVLPGTRLRREESNYAVSFVIPKDTPGMTVVEARHPSDDRDTEEGFDNPVSHGGITQAWIFFDNVFVPNERIFMAGEATWAEKAVFRFTLPYRSAIGGCVAGQGDVIVGASILMARANGLDEKVFRDKIVTMLVNNETTYGMGIAAAALGTLHPSGAWLPDPVMAHANKVHVATLPYETKRLAQEIAGGIAETGCMPSYRDFVDPKYGHLVQKYTKAHSPAETRARIARLVEWLTIGPGVPGCMHGGGSPDGARMVVFGYADFDQMMDAAKRVGGISDISLARVPGK